MGVIVNDLGHVAIERDNLPKVTCCKCGKQFSYRGIKDAGAVKGKTYNFTTGMFEDSGNEEAICDECARKFKGGPLDGQQNWQVRG